ncbi:MAG TPA: hypothetical protein PKG95_13270 [Anaerolineaceae bacterium]|nr:hypothetical protein [Anaerolineaceae bacterium]
MRLRWLRMMILIGALLLAGLALTADDLGIGFTAGGEAGFGRAQTLLLYAGLLIFSGALILPGWSATTPKRVWLPGVLLLGLSVALDLILLYYLRFVDEGDTVTTGWLMAQGHVLYRDLFSHHAPLPYGWAALVTLLAGRSFTAMRLSVILFKLGLIGLGMRLSREYTLLGAVALVWSAIGHFYFGQMLLYDLFAGIPLLVMLAIIVAAGTQKITLENRHFWLLGGLAAVTLFSDPTKVYAIAPLLIWAAGWAIRRQGWGEGARALLKMAAIPVLALGLTTALLGIQGALGAAWADLYQFNTGIYARYAQYQAADPGNYLHQVISGLEILAPQWRSLTLTLEPSTAIDGWLFTGFFYRLMGILGVIGLLIKRRPGLAAAVYLALAGMLTGRNTTFFHAQSFVLAALLLAAWLALGWDAPRRWVLAGWQRLAGTLAAAGLIFLTVMGLWFIANHPERLPYERRYAAYEARGAEMRTFNCGGTDVRLAYYPVDPLVYFFAGMEPPGRFTYLQPWVAELGQLETIEALRTTPTVVYIETDANIWGYTAADYLAPMIIFLNENYVPVAENTWVAPQISCP